MRHDIPLRGMISAWRQMKVRPFGTNEMSEAYLHISRREIYHSAQRYIIWRSYISQPKGLYHFFPRRGRYPCPVTDSYFGRKELHYGTVFWNRRLPRGGQCQFDRRPGLFGRAVSRLVLRRIKAPAGKDEPAKIVIGKDTRRSSYMFEYSLVAASSPRGGRLPAPCHHHPSVAYVARVDDFDGGIMISASHNPYYDNGIKLLNGRGRRWTRRPSPSWKTTSTASSPSSASIGSRSLMPSGIKSAGRSTMSPAQPVYRLPDFPRHLFLQRGQGRPRLRQRSSWNIAKSVFDALGADTYVMGAAPNGLNINDGVGSTHIDALKKFVLDNAWTSASPTTGTPTAASASTRRGRRSPATTSSTSTAATSKSGGN